MRFQKSKERFFFDLEKREKFQHRKFKNNQFKNFKIHKDII